MLEAWSQKNDAKLLCVLTSEVLHDSGRRYGDVMLTAVYGSTRSMETVDLRLSCCLRRRYFEATGEKIAKTGRESGRSQHCLASWYMDKYLLKWHIESLSGYLCMDWRRMLRWAM